MNQINLNESFRHYYIHYEDYVKRMRMRNILPFDFEPHFNYCAQTWHFCNKSLAEKLEKVNERAIRFVFRDKHTTYEELLKLSYSKTLKEPRD